MYRVVAIQNMDLFSEEADIFDIKLKVEFLKSKSPENAMIENH